MRNLPQNETWLAIIESGILADEEIIKCCEKLGALGIDYLKTSTGYAEKGASLEAVHLIAHGQPGRIGFASGAVDVDTLGAQRAAAQVLKKGTLQRQVELMAFYNHPAYLQHQFVILCALAVQFILAGFAESTTGVIRPGVAHPY